MRRCGTVARRAVVVGWAVVALAACAGATAAAPTRPNLDRAHAARILEDAGAYRRAAAELATLRAAVPPDADLDLALALNQARSGELDSAAVLLWSPPLEAALADSLPVERRLAYPSEREAAWINGGFDGWHWYVARARAEVAAAQGRWDDALAAARACIGARPLAGKEWLVLGICAAHAGRLDEAVEAAGRAVLLDPSLPEAHYLDGLFAWRAGRRAEAAARFAHAVALDSTYRDGLLARARVRLPIGSMPGFPAEFLTGVRAAGLLTSPVGPKVEDFVQVDTPVGILRNVIVAVPDTVNWRPPSAMALTVLIDTGGRIVLHDLPWFDPARMPAEMVGIVTSTLPEWAFRPAMRYGEPRPMWTLLDVRFAGP